MASWAQVQWQWQAAHLSIVQAAHQARHSGCPAQVQLTAFEVQHIVGPWRRTRGFVLCIHCQLRTASTALEAQCMPDAIVHTAASHTHQALTTTAVKAVLDIPTGYLKDGIVPWSRDVQYCPTRVQGAQHHREGEPSIQ